MEVSPQERIVDVGSSLSSSDHRGLLVFVEVFLLPDLECSGRCTKSFDWGLLFTSSFPAVWFFFFFQTFQIYTSLQGFPVGCATDVSLLCTPYRISSWVSAKDSNEEISQ